MSFHAYIGLTTMTLMLLSLNPTISASYNSGLDWCMTNNNTFLIVIIAISLLVNLWGRIYFSSKLNQVKLALLTLMFALSMLLFTSGVSTFIQLQGFGLLAMTSILLIMYYNNTTSNMGALSTLLFNKLGDFFLLVAILTQTLSPSTSFTSSIFIYLASGIKSAQYPWSAWLPLAMVAPTPISALVHSSTLVASGALLMLNSTPLTMNTMLFTFSTLSILTAFLLSMTTSDMKKVVALSTMSQLSMVFLLISMSLTQLSMLMLTIHAVIKSILFISMGNLMIASSSAQHKNSLTTSEFMSALIIQISCMALSGLMYTSGYHLKELYLEKSMSTNSMVLLPLLVTMFSTTLFYSIRLSMYYINLNLQSHKMRTPLLPSTVSMLIGYSLFYDWTQMWQPTSPLIGIDLIMLLLMSCLSYTLSIKTQWTKLMIKTPYFISASQFAYKETPLMQTYNTQMMNTHIVTPISITLYILLLMLMILF